MKTFASSEKGYSKQLATAYIAGMMAGSFFYKSKYCSPQEEKRQYLHYVEMPKNKQYELEEKILRGITQMNPEFLRYIESLKCEIRCAKKGKDYIIRFETGGFESLECVVDSNGRCEIIARDAEEQ